MASEVRGDSTTVSFIQASYERDEFYLYSKCNIPCRKAVSLAHARVHALQKGEVKLIEVVLAR